MCASLGPPQASVVHHGPNSQSSGAWPDTLLRCRRQELGRKLVRTSTHPRMRLFTRQKFHYWLAVFSPPSEQGVAVPLIR
jgi:hypothetical protein